MANSILNLSSLNGINGFILKGLEQDSRFGDVVSSAADLNGDGLADLIIGAKDADPNNKESAGKVYVIFGKNTSFAGFSLSNLDGTNGFVINGTNAGDKLGSAIASADLNNDGLSDLIIGANSADANGISNTGKTYVVFGRTSGYNSSFNLSTLNGTNGFAINGVNSGDFSGSSVSNAGDLNSDGIDDLVIGANFADTNGISNTGRSYVVFGKSGGFGANFNLSSLNGSNGFAIAGINKDDYSGISVSGAGDLNGDGINDLIIGANRADAHGRSNSGETYVVFGKSGGFGATLNLANLNGSNGFVIKGINSGDSAGSAVSNAGDFNGDGIDDLIIAAPQADPNGQTNVGEAYIVFGSKAGFKSSFDLSTLNGKNGVVINGLKIDNLSNTSVSSAGDVNGDGIDDVIIGSRNADEQKGESYILFGSSNVFPTRIDLANLEANQGFILKGTNTGDLAGNSVSSAGDVNGDRIDDLIVGAPQANPNSVRDAGESYVIFGQDQRSLTIADFTRGPGQNVNSSGVAEKILIQLNNGEGVTQVDFTITYNPQLLDITGLSLDSNLPTGDWTVSVNKDITGQLKVHLTGDALTKGAANLAYLNAKVPSTATYGATNAIELESIELNGGSFNVIGDQATHLVAYLGDANRDRKYTSADVVAISRLAAGLDSSLSAYSGIDPLLVADINGDGIISALDAALVANVVNGSTNSFIPSLP